MSPYLRPRQKNWPSHYHLTGFWFASEHADINPELEKFIEAGQPPVVVTFGSMISPVNSRIKELLSDVCHRSGIRAVMQGAGPFGRTNDCIFSTGYIPHGWLFPRAACVVLHGGAGTAAAVFRAGVPGVFIPHGRIYDQTYWAQIAWEMGCAVEPISFSDLSVDRLETAIRRTIESKSIRLRTAELGRKIRGGNGVYQAWKMVDDLVDRIGLCD